MATESFNNRLNYMALADVDYLSSRVLVLSGLFLRGHAVFADAMEKQLKLALILINKINSDEELSSKALKKDYRHDLVLLLKEIRCHADPEGIKNFAEGTDEYLTKFENERKRLYPESWEEHTIEIFLPLQDSLYAFFRNFSMNNLPDEEKLRGKQLGGFLFDQHNQQVLERCSGFDPRSAFETRNEHIDEFDIDLNHLTNLGLRH